MCSVCQIVNLQSFKKPHVAGCDAAHPALENLKKEEDLHEFQANLNYLVRPCINMLQTSVLQKSDCGM